MSNLRAEPISLAIANAFITENHRHHGPVQGCKFCIGAYKEGKLVGVSITGRPVSRFLDNGETVEVTRLCTDGTKNACSFLYAASARKAKQLGYKKIQTYILQSENGTSLRATGWTLEKENAGGGIWHRKKPIQIGLYPVKINTEKKQRWGKCL